MKNIFIDMGVLLYSNNGFGLGSLILYEECKNLGIDIELFEDNDDLFHKDRIGVVKEILKENPKTVSFSTRCDTYPAAIDLARSMKEINPKLKIIFGGPHSTLTYQQTLENYPFVDVISIGAGENIFSKILQSDFSYDNLSKINNIAFRHNNKIFLTPYTCNNSNIKTPIKSLIKYSTKHKNEIRIEAGRGCSFNCSFCVTNKVWNKQFRLRQVKDIINDIKQLSNNNLVISFIHDNILADKRLGIEFLNELIKNKPKDLKWKCSCRIDLLDKKTISLLKDAGATGVYLGIETASQKMQQILKKHIDIRKAKKSIRFLNKNNINFVVSLICGHPKEKLNEIYQNLKFGVQMRNYKNCNRVQFHKLAFSFGSQIYEAYKDNLIFNEDTISDQATDKLTENDKKEIKSNKELYSNFYSLKNEPVFGSTTLGQECQNLETLTNAFPKTLRYLISNNSKTFIIKNIISKGINGFEFIDFCFHVFENLSLNCQVNFLKEKTIFETLNKNIDKTKIFNNTFSTIYIPQIKKTFACWKINSSETLSFFPDEYFLNIIKNIKQNNNTSKHLDEEDKKLLINLKILNN